MDLGKLPPLLAELAVHIAEEVTRGQYKVQVAVRKVELDLGYSSK
jgi:hypothetical protein